MNTLSWLGHISLNIAFILYLIVYIPQIIHNQKVTNIAQLSLGLHFLLFSSYFFDLFYGFSSHLPWQDKTVSIVGLLLVTVQHLQLIKFFICKRLVLFAKVSCALLLLSIVGTYYFFIMKDDMLDENTTLIMGTFARICGLIYCIPQIVKNKQSKSSDAINIQFIYLNLVLALLDTTSSWCLNWGWPNKLAAPMNVTMMLMLLLQFKWYEDKAQTSEKPQRLALRSRV